MQNPNSLFNQAFYLMNSNNIENNNEDYSSLIHTNPDFNKNRRFSFRANNDDYKSAIVLFEQFISIKPNCKFAHNYSGVAKVNIKDYQGAIADFTKVISIDPKYANAYHNRAHIRFIQEEYEEAIIDSSKAIALNKNNGDFYEIRGTSKNNLKDFKAAIRDFTKCIELKPNNYRVYRLRAFAYYELKNYEKAIEDFNTVYDYDYENFRAYLSRGKSYFKLKNYKNAIADLAIVVAEDSSIESINKMLKEAKIQLYIEEQTLLEAGMSSKKPLIIEAIATMNNSLLEVLLDDYKTYQDAPKEIFIKKMGGIFEEFKQKEDTELIPFKGKCNSKNCENKGCTGFSFVGNVSKSYLCLVFEETENNFKDIYHCYQFKTEKKIKGLKEKCSFDINRDEEAAFNQSPEYLLKAKGALVAFSEISTTPPQLLDFEQLSYWVDKYAILSAKIGEYDFFQPRMKWTPFARLYSNLNEIKNYLDLNYKPIQIANKQYKTLQTEQNYVDWLVKYYANFDQVPYNLQYSTSLDKGFVNCCFDNKTTILFHGQEYIETYHFLKNYETKNQELLKKYCIYDDEEYWVKYNDSSFEDDISSLNYHLQKREALAKIGIEIPLYLGAK
ncbi:tetratricopeptide repeat protein [Flavobacterium gawalongense]|uniref:Tetratricopeptide repeat protein n=1 Tax=Flavobacterium gawalongense TaxID=2594432 RepID=A0A553BDC3_9FLAO|nr:tetratricopeptide repeat protein [Flavobacterium gawalongense]TRX01345.1 tetratricopeptide repeat protein [Flavobacterium gawalongense]TRX05869.1 tetratricopeptide repeat protein [Flavobacterium gawalongense]TRX06255.1 tetratricopeptide repeat protein [Flavobacterium gawalongense]TRX06999.1 tetratricopeptide repeat protein [Flavobacterium gawalongense]TRX23112.1 tetratricopeptide repeat protein [Flavobacterium gawalongense]